MRYETICDRCEKYETTPCGTREICHAKREGSQVVPWMSDEYINERMSGEKKNCKGYKRYYEPVSEKTRTATKEDFKIGTVLIDSEGNRFGLRSKYDEGIWECNHRVHFENEARFYKVEVK